MRSQYQKKKSVTIPKRGGGVLRKTGKSAVVRGLSSNANPSTSLNPGNIDPSPAPSLRANYTMSRYATTKPINPMHLQMNLSRQQKAWSNVAGATTAKKVYKKGR